MSDRGDPLSARAGVGFGDRVIVATTDVTIAAGIAGRHGTILGHTTPSLGYATNVIGHTPDDVAVNVDFDEGGNAWLAPNLVSFVDVNAGMVIGIGDKRLTRRADGSWADASEEAGR